MDSHNFERLKAHIIPLSVSQDFTSARSEWDLTAIEVSEEMDNCPCGQDIKEHCFITNRLTGHQTYVGNVCINRFMGISTGTLCAGLKRIAQDDTANANDDLIDYAYQKGYLFDANELSFLRQTKLKRNLSFKQLEWKRKINRRILNGTVVARRTAR
jgi:hypothetical protein